MAAESSQAASSFFRSKKKRDHTLENENPLDILADAAPLFSLFTSSERSSKGGMQKLVARQDDAMFQAMMQVFRRGRLNVQLGHVA